MIKVYVVRWNEKNLNLSQQVMIEAVENHMPETIIIDEIGTELEALAASTIAQRGVQLVAARMDPRSLFLFGLVVESRSTYEKQILKHLDVKKFLLMNTSLTFKKNHCQNQEVLLNQQVRLTHIIHNIM